MSRFASPFTVGSQTCWKKSNISQRSALNPLPWLCCKSHLHCQFAGFDPIKEPIGQNIRDKKQYIILLNQNQNIRFYSLLCSFDCQHLFWRRGGSNSNWLNKVWGQHMILWIDCKRCSRQHQLVPTIRARLCKPKYTTAIYCLRILHDERWCLQWITRAELP